MKKFLSMFLFLVFSFCSVAAAEGIDLTAMTLDELVALHQSVDAEIDARIGCEPSEIAGGVYTAGETIKAGAYTITCTAAYTEEGMRIHTYQSHEQYEKCRAVINQYKDDYQLFAGCIQPGQSVTVSLADGMVLVIEDGAGLAEVSVGTWVP